jgi:hypothetical protein
MPGECALVARGQPLAASRLFRAQDFAVRVWWRFGMVCISLAMAILVVVSTLPSRNARDWGVVFPVALIGVAAASMAQMGLIRYRSNRIRFYLLKAGPQADDEPLPPGAPGLPRWSDFWVMLVIAVTVFAIILYGSTRPEHCG